MKLLHYNILDGFRHERERIDAFSAYIGARDYDMLSLNEYHVEEETLEARLADCGYEHSAVNRAAASSNRSAIFSRIPFETIRDDAGFRLLHVRAGGLDFNYHASPRGVATVLAEMEQLLPLLDAPQNAIIAGDFNSLSPQDRAKLRYDRPVEQMRDRYVADGKVSYRMIDSLLAAGFTDLDDGTDIGNTTVPTAIPRPKEPGLTARLDYAFGKLKAFTAFSRVVKHPAFDLLSDHYPVEVVVNPVAG